MVLHYHGSAMWLMYDYVVNLYLPFALPFEDVYGTSLYHTVEV